MNKRSKWVSRYLPGQIVEHKQRVLLEEKRKKAMDMHLEFIVDQTAKYSNWLVKGLASHTPSEPSLQSVATSHDGTELPLGYMSVCVSLRSSICICM